MSLKSAGLHTATVKAGWLRDSFAWGTAGAVVLAAHVTGAIWLMQKAEASQISGLPDPVYVDLAPMPEAAAPLDEQEAIDQAASEGADLEPEPEPEPEETAAADIPLPELPELEPLPDLSTNVAVNDAVVLNRSERPPERPAVKEVEPEPERKIVERKEPEKEQPKERKKPAASAAQSNRTTRLEAPQGQRTAAPRAQQGSPSSPRQVASWQSKVNGAVARHMKRTRLPGGQRGAIQATLQFTITGSGQVSGMRVVSSTGNSSVDSAINRQASRMPRLPAHPSGGPQTLSLPVRID